MARTKSEKFLLTIIVFLVVVFGGQFFYMQIGESWLLLEENKTNKLGQIEQLLAVRSKAPEITARFSTMENELQLKGNDGQQQLFIRQEITKILEETGLRGKYQSINYKDSVKEDDFKIISISIEQVECTPQQLGQLLYRLEKQSKVMEVENCSISNQMSDIGYYSRTVLTSRPQQQLMNGLLSVTLQVSRLVEYATGEAPKK